MEPHRMNMSEQINELASALSKAQGAMKSASKDAVNPHFRSHYATLASVIEAIKEPFAKNGLAMLQPMRVDEQGRVYVQTIIMHASGQWIGSEATVPPSKNDAQGIGSVTSYLRRYQAMSMAGLASEDDDGNAASAPQPQQRQSFIQAIQPTSVYVCTEEQKAVFKDLAAKQGLTPNMIGLKVCSDACVKAKVTMGQLEAAIKEWLEENP